MVKKVLKIKTDYGAYDCVFTLAKDVAGYIVEARGVSGGAFTQGRNLAEAKKMIKEAIEGMVEAQELALRFYIQKEAIMSLGTLSQKR